MSNVGPVTGRSLRAQAFMLNQEMRAARRELDAALAAVPGNFEARLVDVTWQMNNGQSERGMQQQLAVLLKEYGTTGEVWSLSGAIHHARGEFAAALEDCDRALARAPRNLDVRIARISLLVDLDRDAESAADFTYLELSLASSIVTRLRRA